MKQNNCKGCGCINQDQCICLKEELNNIMKKQHKGKYTTLHPAGVAITFTSWQDYNKYTTHHPVGVDITFNSWEEYNKYTTHHPAGVNVDVQVKVDRVAEFIDIWDVLYPREKQ